MASSAGAAIASAAEGPALRVLESYEVAGEPSTATDVRWAGSRSVYLARRYHGVAEVKLEAGLPQVRRVVPGLGSLGLRASQPLDRMAASADYMAVAGSDDFVAWRSLAKHTDFSVHFDRKAMWSVEDLDLSGDRLLLLGALAYDPESPFSPDGAVAFLGSAREDGRQTLRPILFDPAGQGAPHLLACLAEGLGSARFLADGSFFIVPGFQPGAYLFSAEGEVIHTWNTTLLGLDEDAICGRRTLKERNDLHRGNSGRLLQHLNQHRIVDEVLPLPAGPGLVIRSVEAGTVRWELDVLSSRGVETYGLPLPSPSAYVRASGDVRAGKIVLLVADRRYEAQGRKAVSHLVVLQAPAH